MIFKERKKTKILGGILFTTFLSLLIMAVSLSSVTEYSSLKPVFSVLITSQIPGEQASQLYTLILLSCEKTQTVDIPLGIESISLQCKDIKSAGQGGFLDLVATKLFDKIYYKSYSCNFLDCIKQSPLVIISQHANIFMKNVIYMLLALAILSAMVLAISSRGWGIAKSFGTSLIFVGMSYFVIIFSKSLIPSQIMQVGGEFINSILDTIAFNFLVVLIAGIAITAIWFVLGRKKKK